MGAHAFLIQAGWYNSLGPAGRIADIFREKKADVLPVLRDSTRTPMLSLVAGGAHGAGEMITASAHRVIALVCMEAILGGSAQALDCWVCECPSRNKLYHTDTLCAQECPKGTGCVGYSQCTKVSLPGRAPTASEITKLAPGAACYSITAKASSTYNCVAHSVGFTDRFIRGEEVDAVYGNGNRIPEVTDFDAFYASVGYTSSADCVLVANKHKIVLYGNVDASGRISNYHVARQEFQVFRSKLGYDVEILHGREDLVGGKYGTIVKCYEQ